jgi:hypothetical protein
LAISDDEADLHGDTAASFSFASLVNALTGPLDDDNEVISDQVKIESVITVESLDMTWFNTHGVGDLRRALISFLLPMHIMITQYKPLQHITINVCTV